MRLHGWQVEQVQGLTRCPRSCASDAPELMRTSQFYGFTHYVVLRCPSCGWSEFFRTDHMTSGLHPNGNGKPNGSGIERLVGH